MFVQLDADVLRRQDYDCALRAACDQLSAQGIRNWIDYWPERRVRLLDDDKVMRPVVDHEAGGMRLVPA